MKTFAFVKNCNKIHLLFKQAEISCAGVLITTDRSGNLSCRVEKHCQTAKIGRHALSSEVFCLINSTVVHLIIDVSAEELFLHFLVQINEPGRITIKSHDQILMPFRMLPGIEQLVPVNAV